MFRSHDIELARTWLTAHPLHPLRQSPFEVVVLSDFEHNPAQTSLAFAEPWLRRFGERGESLLHSARRFQVDFSLGAAPDFIQRHLTSIQADTYLGRYTLHVCGLVEQGHLTVNGGWAVIEEMAGWDRDGWKVLHKWPGVQAVLEGDGFAKPAGRLLHELFIDPIRLPMNGGPAGRSFHRTALALFRLAPDAQKDLFHSFAVALSRFRFLGVNLLGAMLR